MDTTDDYYAATPEERAAMLTRAQKRPTHRSTDSPAYIAAYDAALATRRALEALTARTTGLPRPTPGTHRGVARDA